MAPQFGLNLPNKNPSGPKPANPFGQKRKKNIFDDDSGDEKQNEDREVEVSTIGGLDAPAPKPSKPFTTAGPPPKRKMQLGSGKPSARPLDKGSIFADDEDEDEEKDKGQGEVRFGLNQAQSKKPTPPGKDYTNLSALHSSKQHAKEAEEVDPSIYSYDAVYDSLHVKPDQSAAATKSETPKYMTNLLRSAEIRKRDQLRARDRQLAKEREAEGDEFADKEAFVTSAYKAQQAEMRKVEEEEAQREKEEEERRKQNGGAGMVGFYRDVLSRGEAKHEQAVKAAEEAARRVKAGETTEDTAKSEEKSEDQKAEDLNAHGARVAINDEGQVVDKRQLLSAGLNVAPKPKAAPSAAPTTAARPAGRPGPNAGYQSGRAGQRARQTEMITRQLEEQARQEEAAEAARQKEAAEKARSRKTTGDVSSAKERYLARKREREEAAAKEKANAK